MQRFRFRLDSILRLRTAELARERETMRLCLLETARLEALLTALTEQRIEAKAFVQNDRAAGITELRSLAGFLLGSEARTQSLRRAVESSRQAAAEQRARVLTADQNERLLLKLKEKRLAEWQHEIDREQETVAQEC